MKTFLLISLSIISLSLFAKGGNGPTEKCIETRAKVAEGLADDVDIDIKILIQQAYYNGGIKVKKDEIIRTQVIELADRIGIFHEVSNEDPRVFMTAYPVLGIDFLGEKIVKGKNVCQWLVKSLDSVQVRSMSPDRSMGHFEFTGRRKINIPLP